MLASLTSGLYEIENLKEIAIARVLDYTPFVGLVGRVIFMSCSFSVMKQRFSPVRTFDGLTRKVEPNYAEHQVISQKPISEFVGNTLVPFTMHITLHSGLGVEPLVEYKCLKRMAESGRPQIVFLHGRYEGKFTIRSVEAEELEWYHGRPAVMEITLTLKEYVKSLPKGIEQKLKEEAAQALADDEQLAELNIEGEDTPLVDRELTEAVEPPEVDTGSEVASNE